MEVVFPAVISLGHTDGEPAFTGGAGMVVSAPCSVDAPGLTHSLDAMYLPEDMEIIIAALFFFFFGKE